MSYQKSISMAVVCAGAVLLTGLGPANAQTYTYQGRDLTVVSRVNGATIKDSQGADLGRIQDLLADNRTGNIDAAVISINNKAGDFTVVPWSLLQPAGNNTYVFKGDPNKLWTAQTFSSNNWPDFANSDYLPRVYSYYGVTYPTAVGGPTVITGVETGTIYQDYGPAWIRPQPDGKDVFPWLNHPEAPWKR